MRLSRFPLNTLKEAPADAEIVSHRLMLRAGLIRKLSSGLYTWLPLGLRVLRKVERVVREEMDRIGCLEVLMPMVQPAELWEETGRWDKFGPQLLQLQDRHQRSFCLGPTHEEVITDLVRRELKSYRDVPVTYYQIQTKFRDEIRPRFGIMRAREFLMKDAYSFHLDSGSLNETYQAMHEAYCRIFGRLGLEFRPVEADTGAIGGSASHEFHVLAQAGEDEIAFSDGGSYAANVEKVPTRGIRGAPPPGQEAMAKVATPGVHTIADLAALLGVPPEQCLKTLVVSRGDGHPVALVLRGDHSLNEVKAQGLLGTDSGIQFVEPDRIRENVGCGPGSLGPVGMRLPIYVDFAAAEAADFVCGANEDGFHWRGVNWGRDLPVQQTADLRNATEGDPSPKDEGRLHIVRGIEVGHIFQLGDRYSRAMGATVQDEQGKEVPLVMGCYGVGVSRLVAAAIEQHHDIQGICWPVAMAPFSVVVAPINYHRSEPVAAAADRLYNDLISQGFDAILDDRGMRPGVMFAELDLVGIPHRVVLSEKSLGEGKLEYKRRGQDSPILLEEAELIERLRREGEAE